MPFRLIYSVKFWNGNLHPHVNTNGWPDMKLCDSTAANQAEWFPDASGMTFRVTRGPTPQAGVPARNYVFVKMPWGGFPLKSRLRLQVIFDAPLAEGFSPDGTLHTIPFPPDPNHTIPEPWAVALNVSSWGDLTTELALVNVTCQFTRREVVGGFRLNTPGSLQDGDPAAQGAQLVRPLDYQKYNPNSNPPTLFTLEHFFSGHLGRVTCGHTPPETKTHTTGSGYLSYHPLGESNVEDHRNYSSDVFLHTAPEGPIAALGPSVGTKDGIGRFTAHLRSFSVWINEPIP